MSLQLAQFEPSIVKKDAAIVERKYNFRNVASKIAARVTCLLWLAMFCCSTVSVALVSYKDSPCYMKVKMEN